MKIWEGVFDDGQPQRLQKNMRCGKTGKFALYEKERKHRQGCVDTNKYGGLRNHACCRLVYQNGDTARTPDGEIVGGDKRIRRK